MGMRATQGGDLNLSCMDALAGSDLTQIWAAASLSTLRRTSPPFQASTLPSTFFACAGRSSFIRLAASSTTLSRSSRLRSASFSCPKQFALPPRFTRPPQHQPPRPRRETLSARREHESGSLLARHLTRSILSRSLKRSSFHDCARFCSWCVCRLYFTSLAYIVAGGQSNQPASRLSSLAEAQLRDVIGERWA
jgi:hypothetical protein